MFNRKQYKFPDEKQYEICFIKEHVSWNNKSQALQTLTENKALIKTNYLKNILSRTILLTHPL